MDPNEFISKLKALMAEYNAIIGFSCDIDSFGDTKNDFMNIWVDNEKIEEMPGWSFKAEDL